MKAGGFADQKKVSTSFVLGERFIVGFRPGCGSTAHGFGKRRFWFGALERKPFHGIWMSGCSRKKI